MGRGEWGTTEGAEHLPLNAQEIVDRAATRLKPSAQITQLFGTSVESQRITVTDIVTVQSVERADITVPLEYQVV
jgi:hypothetical protein